MKRLTAILLALVTLVMLLPASTLVSAETVTAKPFYTLNGSELWEPEPYVLDRPKFTSPTITENYTYLVSAYGSKDVKTIAQKTKEDFDSRPEGTRYINLNLMTKAVHGLVEKNIYFDKAEDAIRGWVEEFITEYHKIGGKLDGITVDLEYIYCGAWYIHLGALNKNDNERYNNPNLFFDIVEDPRYLTEIRPMLEEQGFPFQKASSKATEIHGIDKQNSAAYRIWNVVMQNRKSLLIDRSVYEPMAKYYPDANVCDYQVGYTYGWQKTVKDDEAPLSGNRLGCGTTSSFNAYTARPSNTMSGYTSKNVPADKPSYATPAACNDAWYELTAFNRCLWDVNILKNMMEATPSGKIACHTTFFNYAPNKVGTYSNTPYYTENMLHTGLMDPQPFMGYIREVEVFNQGDVFEDPNMGDYGYAIKVVNDIMAELTRVAGASDRKPIPVPATWNSRFILSGMYAGGRNIWRITPDTFTGVSKEDFKVKDKAPTFYIDGQTITFPQGRIIEDGSVRQVGTCGYWVETPANVMPVITNDIDRYREYAPLLENFEGYEVGTVLDSNTALPKATWSSSGDAATIQSVGSGKALALTGISIIKSTKLPANITAGDSYAKQQAWEVTVTLPESGKLRVLSHAETDQGIRIENGKVYYPENGKQTELSGVTLSAGESYIFKKEVDFRTSGAYKVSYSVYDAGGKRLGGVDNVALGGVILPVSEVGFYATSVSDKAYIDDFKMYPTGVTTELEAYDAKSGYKLDGLSASKDTAYRLSWMNASSEYKVAKVYNNGTLVEEIKMAPGQDGVSTDIVKGSSIHLSVTTENGSAPAATNYDNGDFSWTSVAKSIGLAIGAPSGGGNNGGSTGNNGGSNTANPDTGVDATGPNGGADATTPNGGADATTPSGNGNGGNSGSNNSGENKPGVTDQAEKDGLSGGAIALIVIASVLVLAGGGFALCWFVIKPKWLMELDVTKIEKLLERLTKKN